MKTIRYIHLPSEVSGHRLETPNWYMFNGLGQHHKMTKEEVDREVKHAGTGNVQKVKDLQGEVTVYRLKSEDESF